MSVPGPSRRAGQQYGPRPGPTSFEDFFTEERDRLFRMLCVVTGSRSEAEDVTQDAFLKVWERWGRVRDLDSPTGYLYRVAMNRWRSRRRRARMAMRRAIGVNPIPDVFEAIDDRDRIDRALASLSPRQRAAIVLTEVQDITVEEAADLLAIRPSTVRALTFQARSALRRREETP